MLTLTLLAFSFQFPHSNISLILSKLRGPASAHISHIKTAFSDADPDNTGTMPFDQFRYVMNVSEDDKSITLKC